MADSFIILTDSGSDLTKEMARELQVQIMPLLYTLEGEDPKPGDEVDIKDFYQQLRSGKSAKTSAANYEDLMGTLEPIAAQGSDVLYIAFSSGLSSTAGTATLVAGELSEKYPERKIYVVDSLSASLGHGLLVYLAARQRAEGKSIDDVRDYVEENKLHICHNVTVDDLHHLHKGGRVSKATAIVGTMVKIKPIIHVDNEGKLQVIAKERGRKRSLNKIVEMAAERAKGWDNDIVMVTHGDCIEEAEYVAELAKEKLGAKEVLINNIGTVIGSHTGPGVVAIFYMGEER